MLHNIKWAMAAPNQKLLDSKGIRKMYLRTQRWWDLQEAAIINIPQMLKGIMDNMNKMRKIEDIKKNTQL